MEPEQRARLKVVMVDTRNPLNIGAAARAMSNFGFFDLRLVHPYGPSLDEAVSAVGAAELLKSAEVYQTVGEAVADCSLVVGATGLGHRQILHPLHRLEKGGRIIRRHLTAGNAALLFGSEKFGLGVSDVSHCHWLVHIPTRPDHDSMNLGQAVAVCLYELIRQPSAARHWPEAAELAEGERLERFTSVLEELLGESGYTDHVRLKGGPDKTRRLVRRLRMRSQDVDVWTGMLRQILWKMNNPKPDAMLADAMTKVEARYEFTADFKDEWSAAIEALHGVYGLQSAKLSPKLDSLAVTYDASRLTLTDVEAHLRRAGLPLRKTDG